MSDRLLSIILPVFNQADHIGTLVEQHQSGLAGLPHRYEMLLVVNGCRDDSLLVCQALSEEHAAIRVVHSEAGGWGLAVKLGLQEARGDVLCYANSARTATRDLILCLLYSVAYPDVVVKANRKIRDSAFRRLGSLLYNLECRALFDLANWDVNGTPKVFPRRFDRLLSLEREDDLIDAEFLLACRGADYPIVEIPILSSERRGGRSTTSIRSAVRMYWHAYRMWRTSHGSAQ